MIHRLLSLTVLTTALFALAAPAHAQQPVDPSSKSWQVELKGVVQPGESFDFFPNAPGSNQGTWINADDDNVWGWGLYTWDPVSGILEYINLSGDGGGYQTGVYSWTGKSYRRTWASHPQAPPMSLL